MAEGAVWWGKEHPPPEPKPKENRLIQKPLEDNEPPTEVVYDEGTTPLELPKPTIVIYK